MTRIVLMDGGMGQELIARSANPPSPLWSARVMLDEPQIVEATHRDYVEAGARVLILNAYSATPERLARDASEDLFEPLQARAIEIARRAIADSGVRLAGCLPPLAGSYHPDRAPNFDTSLSTYRRIVACQHGGVDLLACETLASVAEITAATRAGVESGLPVWCAMSVDDTDGTKLRSGEPVADGAAAARREGAQAIAVNCSRPEAVAQALPFLKASGLPFGAWANGFVDAANDLSIGGIVSGMAVRTDLGPETYADHAMSWVDMGATIIGGCCEVGPAHIAHLAQRLRDAGHEIVGDLS